MGQHVNCASSTCAALSPASNAHVFEGCAADGNAGSSADGESRRAECRMRCKNGFASTRSKEEVGVCRHQAGGTKAAYAFPSGGHGIVCTAVTCPALVLSTEQQARLALPRSWVVFKSPSHIRTTFSACSNQQRRLTLWRPTATPTATSSAYL